MGPSLDIRGLKYFISAAECLNFTRAAKECFITQTAMSQHIANMEKELGFQLFIRNNRNVELTVAGKDFYEQVKNIVHSYDHAVRHSQNLSTGSEGSISVIISSSIDGLAFMPRFRYFKAHHPTISLTVRISSPRYMVDQLKRGEADIAICWPEEMQQNDDIFVQNLAEFKGCLSAAVTIRWQAVAVSHRKSCRTPSSPLLISPACPIPTGLTAGTGNGWGFLSPLRHRYSTRSTVWKRFCSR